MKQLLRNVDRWLILRRVQLEILSKQGGKLVFSIRLKDVTGVSRSENLKLAIEIIAVKGADPNVETSATQLRELPTKSFFFVMASDDEIYAWIDAISARCPGRGGVNTQTNSLYGVHGRYDPDNDTRLPQEWESLPSASATKEDGYEQHRGPCSRHIAKAL